jgi:hypothetical protein
MSSANTIKSFFQQQHNLRRHPFAPPGTPVKTTGKSFWNDLKVFFKTHHNLRRHPFDIKV